MSHTTSHENEEKNGLPHDGEFEMAHAWFSCLFLCMPPSGDRFVGFVREVGPSWVSMAIGGPHQDIEHYFARVPSSCKGVGRGFIFVSCVISINVHKESK